MIEFLLQFEVYNIIFITIGAAVIELNDGNFNTRLHDQNLSLIIFYTPWCLQCSNLLMKLPEIDQKVQNISSTTNIFTVECDVDGKLTCKNNQIGGYPVLKSFRGNKEYGKFEGNRDVSSILSFMQIEAAPVARKLNNFKNIEQELRKENRVCLVASLRKQSKIEVIFFEIAEKLRRNICFLYSLNNSTYTWIKLYRDPKLWNIFEDIFIEYEGEENITMLEEFIRSNYHGLVAIRTFSNRKEFDPPLTTAYFKLDYKMNPKGTKYWHNRILKIASKYKNYFYFAMSSTKDFEEELREVGVNNFENDIPIVIVTLETDEKFLLKDNFSLEVFDIFLHNILHKMSNPYLKSQPVPDNNEARVVEAVGSTFYDLAMNHANDTMVQLFAKWCDHCKTISPLFEELADRMKNENICFVKIDATQNDVPHGYTPRGYPTFYWSTKENRLNPVEYRGTNVRHVSIDATPDGKARQLFRYAKTLQLYHVPPSKDFVQWNTSSSLSPNMLLGN